jgi:hypothetical protein
MINPSPSTWLPAPRFHWRTKPSGRCSSGKAGHLARIPGLATAARRTRREAAAGEVAGATTLLIQTAEMKAWLSTGKAVSSFLCSARPVLMRVLVLVLGRKHGIPGRMPGCGDARLAGTPRHVLLLLAPALASISVPLLVADCGVPCESPINP